MQVRVSQICNSFEREFYEMAGFYVFFLSFSRLIIDGTYDGRKGGFKPKPQRHVEREEW